MQVVCFLMNPSTILVVDDDPHIREVLRYALEKEGLRVVEADNGLMALEKARQILPDVIILDIVMPEMNGLDVCRELRKTDRTPILFLSSKESELDRILGLELGGDDYVTKPFSPRELLARVNVMLRRLTMNTPPLTVAEHVLKRGGIELDLQTYQVSWQEKPVALTATEFNLLHTLMLYPNKVYTRDELILGDIFKDIVSDRTIDSHIRRLRQKFASVGCQNVVETAHGFGYKLGINA